MLAREEQELGGGRASAATEPPLDNFVLVDEACELLQVSRPLVRFDPVVGIAHDCDHRVEHEQRPEERGKHEDKHLDWVVAIRGEIAMAE